MTKAGSKFDAIIANLESVAAEIEAHDFGDGAEAAKRKRGVNAAMQRAISIAKGLAACDLYINGHVVEAALMNSQAATHAARAASHLSVFVPDDEVRTISVSSNGSREDLEALVKQMNESGGGFEAEIL